MMNFERPGTLFLALAMALGGTALLLAAPPAEAAPQFWNGPDGWNYRAPLFINNTGSAGSLVQVPFNFPTSSLISNGKLRGDCGDLRIATETGTLLPYWIESGCGSTARVWVRLTTLAAGSQTLNVYYGNPNATPVSELNNTFIGDRTWVDQVSCPTAPMASCLISNHGVADNYRSLAPDCTVSRLAVDYGVPSCGFASSFGTDNLDHFIAEYHFIFVPDVTGTWQFQWYAGYSGELVVNPTDDELYHSMTVIAGSYTPTNTTIPHTGSRNLSAGVGEFYSFIVSEATGIEGSRIKIARPGGSFQTLNPTNFPGMYFRRTYPTGVVGAALGTESTLPASPTGLTASPGPGAGEITLSWNAVSGATGYHVYSSTSSLGPFTISANVSGNSAVLSGLPETATRYAKVSAYTNNGAGPLSATVSATTWSRPSAPGTLALTASNGSISLSWPAPGSDGGTPVTNYRIYRGTSTATTYLAQTGGANRTFTANGLTNGVTYFFNVTAENLVGQGATSNKPSAIPAGAPYPPGTPQGARGDTWVDLWWPAGSSNGAALDDHRIYVGTSPGTASLLATTGGANTTFRVNGLTNGVLYYFHVTAHNAYGWSSASAEVSARPARPPDAPIMSPVTINNGSITASWTPPANDGGEPITYYLLYNGSTPSNLQLCCGYAGTTITWSGTNGQQICLETRAVSSAGAGALSGVKCGTPQGVPYPPVLLGAIIGNRSLEPYWSPPFDSNSGISGYRVYNGSTLVCTQTPSSNSCPIAGLANGYAYTYTVKAFNSVGESNVNNAMIFTPASIPNPPGALTAQAANRSIVLSWTPPYDQGSALSHYSVWNGTTLVKTLAAPASSTTVGSLTNGYAYTFNVTAHNAIGESLSSNIVTRAPGAVPDTVPSLVATRGNQSVLLTWGVPASNGYALTAYEVWDDGILVATTLTPTFTHSPIANGVLHNYTVTASNALGRGAHSAVASARPASIPYPPSLTAVRGDGTVELSWSIPYDQGEPITSYRVWNGTSVVSILSGTSLQVTGLQNGYTYTYHVAAINAVGESVYSNAASATPAGVPTAVKSLTASASNRSASIAWAGATGNGASITAYEVHRSIDGGAYALLATVPATAASFVDTGLTNGLTHSYRVAAVNAVGASATPLAASAVPASFPDPPQFLSAARGSGVVDLAWISGNAQGSAVCTYELYRGLASGGARALIAQLTGGPGCAPPTTYHDSGLTNGVLYVYNLTAINGIGRSNTSADITARPAAPPSEPRFPAAGFRDGGAEMFWTAPTSNGGEPILNYQVYVREVGGNFTAWGPRVPSSPTLVTGLTNGVTYRLAVAAANAAGIGALSSEVEVIPTRPPDAPANLTATPASRQVRLDWSAPVFEGGRPVSAYRIAWYDGATQLGSAEIGTNRSYVVTQLVDGRIYSFTLSARNLAGWGSPTEFVPSMPYGPPSAPTITSVTQLSPSSSITLQWNAPTSDGGRALTQYRLYGSNTPGGERSFIATVPAATTSYTDTIPAGASRTYVVLAVNSQGSSPPSAEATGSRLPDPLAPVPETYRSCSRDASTGSVACTQGAQARVQSLAAGARHTCALLQDGRVDCWGDDHAGQSADHISGRPVVAVTAGGAHTCALLDNGRVDCWGSDNAGQARSSLDTNASQVSAGDTHTCILRTDGSAVCQGTNSYGESASRTGVFAVSAGGRHTCFLLTNASMDCQGRASEGQSTDVWTQDILEVSAGGYHTCYRRASGVACQGDIAAPPAFPSPVTQLATGRGHACALLENGNVVCWGAGRDGQSAGYALGDAVAVDAGDTHTCVLTTAGTIRCWGATGVTNYGQAQAYPLAQEASTGNSQANATLAIQQPTAAITMTRKETE